LEVRGGEKNILRRKHGGAKQTENHNDAFFCFDCGKTALLRCVSKNVSQLLAPRLCVFAANAFFDSLFQTLDSK